MMQRQGGSAETGDDNHDRDPRPVPQPDLEDRPPTYHRRFGRSLKDVLLAKGVFTAEDARNIYRVVVDPVTGALDVAGTRRLRGTA